jgi:hypothetical protein
VKLVQVGALLRASTVIVNESLFDAPSLSVAVTLRLYVQVCVVVHENVPVALSNVSHVGSVHVNVYHVIASHSVNVT